jgi:hypothetical protein
MVVLGIPFGNTLRSWGTTWEHGRNTSATPKRKEKKKKPLPPPSKTQIKKLGPEWMLHLLIGCMQFLFPKLLVTIFGLG